jgi:Protein of unknown function (DUF3775)
MLDVNPETVRSIIDRAHQFQMLGQGESGDRPDGWDSTYSELKATIDDLEPDQQMSLVGLMWLGRGDYQPAEWERALSDARERWTARTADYLIGTPLLADYLADGLEQLGYFPE